MSLQSAAAPRPLTLAHALLAVAVMAVWGSNFVVIRIGLDHLPPLLFSGLRFTLAVLPAIFFLKRPDVPWWNLIAYGLAIGAGQFGLLFLAISGFITPGLASLVVQAQVFFTIGLAMVISSERVRPFQVVALGLAVAGIAIILFNTDRSTTPLGLALVLVAAMSWSVGNIVSARAKGVNMLAYVVWGSLFSAPSVLLLSLVFEGPQAMAKGLHEATLATWAAVVWQATGNTMFGYVAWGWLLSRYPAASVTPMALLVPIFGMGTSALFLGEPLPGWKLAAASLVMAGLALNILWPRYRSRHLARQLAMEPGKR